MTSCQKNWNYQHGVFDGKCKKYGVPGCWKGYDTWEKTPGKCTKKKIRHWYTRRTGTSYNSTQDSGPAGHPKANSFSPILFEKKVAGLLWLDNAVKRGKGPNCCPYRCKGHNRLKGQTPYQIATSSNAGSSSRSVIPPFNSYSDVLAVRKAMAYYNPKNYKKNKKWKRANCRY